MRSLFGPRRSQCGFGDARLAIAIAIVASLAVGGVALFRRSIHRTKTAEARLALAEIAADAARAYQENVGPDGRHRLCTTSTYVPADTEAISARFYQSSGTEWGGTDALAGWKCLHYEILGPQYSRYHYESAGGGGPGASYVATAERDYDGNGVLSRFSVHGVVDANGQLRADPEVVEETPYEE